MAPVELNDGRDEPAPPRRTYESPVRRQQAVETHERIVLAGAELVHDLPGWDWRELTMKAVAERAGVHVRTVYRHFATERELHDAVMGQLVEESGIDLDSLELEGLADSTRDLFRYLSSFPVAARPHREPTFADLDRQRRESLRDAVVRITEGWSEGEREIAAGILDVMWSIPTYERLHSAWDLDAEQAAQAVTWVIDLLEQAIREGHRPGPSAQARSPKGG
jgi:AcrR family transcriptional regulator